MKFLIFLNNANFNIYDLIIFMLIFQSIIFCGLLLSRQNLHASHYLLTSFIASIGIGQFGFFCLYNTIAKGLLNNFLNETGFALVTGIFFIQGLLLYSYVRSLAYGFYRFSRSDFIPIGIFLFVALASPWLWNEFLVRFFWRPFVLVSVVGFFVSVIYGIKSLIFIKRYFEQLKNHFCNLEQIELFWLQLFVVGYLAIWMLQISPPFFYTWVPWWLQQVLMHSGGLLNLFMMNFVFFAGLVRARKMQSIKELTAESAIESSAEIISATDTADMAALKQLLDQRIRNEALYAQPNLNIERLARVLDLPVRQLSNVINREFRQNYFEFINHYRIETVKARLSTAEWNDKSIQEIYESAGFSSKSTFFTLFRKQEGMTPLAYREKTRV